MDNVIPGPGTLQFAFNQMKDPLDRKFIDHPELVTDEEIKEMAARLPGGKGHHTWPEGPWQREGLDLFDMIIANFSDDLLKNPINPDNLDDEDALEYTISQWYLDVRFVFRPCGCGNCGDAGDAVTCIVPEAITRGERRFAPIMNKYHTKGWRKHPRVLAFIRQFDGELEAADWDLMKTKRWHEYACSSAPLLTHRWANWSLQEWPRQ